MTLAVEDEAGGNDDAMAMKSTRQSNLNCREVRLGYRHLCGDPQRTTRNDYVDRGAFNLDPHYAAVAWKRPGEHHTSEPTRHPNRNRRTWSVTAASSGRLRRGQHKTSRSEHSERYGNLRN
jgi:hypothetical protein